MGYLDFYLVNGLMTHEKLKAMGMYSETMDDIINRIMFVKKTGKSDQTDVEKKLGVEYKGLRLFCSTNCADKFTEDENGGVVNDEY